MWGWRVPFLLSGVLVLFGVLVRRHLEEPIEFQVHTDEIKLHKSSKLAPLGKLFKQDWSGLVVDSSR